jgi:hypothetical protein
MFVQWLQSFAFLHKISMYWVKNQKMVNCCTQFAQTANTRENEFPTKLIKRDYLCLVEITL